VLYATARDQDKRKVFEAQRVYMPQCSNSLGPMMVLGPDKKLGIIRDTTFQPGATKREVFDIRLSKPIQRLDVKLRLVYQLRPGDEIPIHQWERRLDVAGLFPKAAH